MRRASREDVAARKQIVIEGAEVAEPVRRRRRRGVRYGDRSIIESIEYRDTKFSTKNPVSRSRTMARAGKRASARSDSQRRRCDHDIAERATFWWKAADGRDPTHHHRNSLYPTDTSRSLFPFSHRYLNACCRTPAPPSLRPLLARARWAPPLAPAQGLQAGSVRLRGPAPSPHVPPPPWRWVEGSGGPAHA